MRFSPEPGCSRSLGAWAAVLVLLLASAPALLAPPARAAGTLESTIAYLERAENADGGFGTAAGRPSDPSISAWASLAIAASGTNPQDQRVPDGKSAYAYLTAQAGQLEVVPDYERALLIADAAGTSPRDFGGRDLLATILGAALPDGSFPYRAGEATPDVNDTSFAVLALSPVDEPEAHAATERGAEWLIAAQNRDGSWPSACPRTVPRCTQEGEPLGEVDATAAAIEALNAAGLGGTEAQQRALEWIARSQLADGGLPEYPSESEANVASTAWVAQALWAAGQDPAAWAAPQGNPLTFMASLQQSDGSIDWRAGQSSEPVWMTAYVAPALAGRALPIAAVPRALSPPLPSPAAPVQAAPSTSPVSAAASGERQRSGVRTGGGGSGAPLFSRPQPQSRGARAGGARETSVPPAARRSGGSRVRRNVEGLDAASRSRHSTTAGTREVKGVLLAAHRSPAAPGLAAASSGEPGASLAVGIGVAALAALALGALLECRRAGAWR